MFIQEGRIFPNTTFPLPRNINKQMMNSLILSGKGKRENKRISTICQNDVTSSETDVLRFISLTKITMNSTRNQTKNNPGNW